MTFLRSIGAAAALLALIAPPAQAQSFTPIGDVTLAAGEAVLSTAAVASGETPYSGQSALTWNALEAGLGLAGGATLGADAIEGSALLMSFTAPVAVRVGFDWWLGPVDAFDPAFADRAFFVVDGHQVGTLATLGAAPQSGRFTLDFAAGAHTLAVGLVDVGDSAGVSALALNQLDVSPAPVPEPQTLALWAAGAALLALRRRRGAAADAQSSR